MISSLQQQFLHVWPIIWFSDFIRYSLAAGVLVTLLFVLRWFLEHRTIQPRSARWSDIRREISYSMSTIVLFSLVGFGIYLGGQSGLFLVDREISPTWGAGLFDLAVMIVAHDAYFYWIHRAMHHPRLYQRFHRLHHLSRTPTPWAAYSFAPPEAIVEAAFLPLILLFFGTSSIVVFSFTTHMIVRNVMGHAGIELFPKKWLQWPILRAITTTTHHDLHHAEFRWNYGLYFRWWDRMMGTEHPKYEEKFDKATFKANSLGSAALPQELPELP